GCMAWALATGVPPFLGHPAQLAVAHRSAPLPSFEPTHPMPSELLDWLTRCLAKRPSARFRSAAEAAEALASLPETTDAPVTTASPDRRERFVLSTLLDLPEAGPSTPITATQGTLYDIFEQRGAYRPSIPTKNLLHHGDPEILGQRAAQEHLWTLLLRTVSNRRRSMLRLTGPRGQGHRMLLRWLRRRAHMAGLHPVEEPVEGHLAIVDATGTSMEDWRGTSRQPWLLVWRGDGPASVPEEPLVRLSPDLTWWVLHARILVAPQLAADAALQSLGTPGLALQIVEDWLDDPGAHMHPQGLVLRRRPRDVTPRTRAWWENEVTTWEPERRHFARLAALCLPGFDGATLRGASAEAGCSAELETVGFAVNDAWRLPPSLRSLLLDEGTPDDHALLARHATLVQRRLLHELEADPGVETTRRVVDLLTARQDPLTAEAAHTLELHMDLHLLDHPSGRRWCRLQTLPPERLRQIADRGGPEGDHALVVLARRGTVPCEELEARMDRSRDPGVRTWLMLFASRARLDQDPDSASSVEPVERLLACLDPDHPAYPYHRDLLLWTRASCWSDTPRAEAACREALDEVVDPGIRGPLCTDLAHLLLEGGRFAEALEVMEGSSGGWDHIPGYNRMLCHLGLDDLEAAGRVARAGATAAVADRHGFVLPGLLTTLLADGIDERAPIWDQLRSLTGRVRDPLTCSLVGRALDTLPPSERRDSLRGLLVG
ncbi:MAG: hypothetical protein KC656_22845, partial [Myxococcales bacterium]|nr:hypothetical protein [Myxococcales bacterium]